MRARLEAHIVKAGAPEISGDRAPGLKGLRAASDVQLKAGEMQQGAVDENEESRQSVPPSCPHKLPPRHAWRMQNEPDLAPRTQYSSGLTQSSSNVHVWETYSSQHARKGSVRERQRFSVADDETVRSSPLSAEQDGLDADVDAERVATQHARRRATPASEVQSAHFAS